MFAEPELFNAVPEFAKRVQPRGSGAHDIKLRSDSIRARFWMAQAKHENGGLDATSEQMLKVRDRYRQ